MHIYVIFFLLKSKFFFFANDRFYVVRIIHLLNNKRKHFYMLRRNQTIAKCTFPLKRHDFKISFVKKKCHQLFNILCKAWCNFCIIIILSFPTLYFCMCRKKINCSFMFNHLYKYNIDHLTIILLVNSYIKLLYYRYLY